MNKIKVSVGAQAWAPFLFMIEYRLARFCGWGCLPPPHLPWVCFSWLCVLLPNTIFAVLVHNVNKTENFWYVDTLKKIFS